MKECQMPGCRVPAEVEYSGMKLCHDCHEKEIHRMDSIVSSMQDLD